MQHPACNKPACNFMHRHSWQCHNHTSMCLTVPCLRCVMLCCAVLCCAVPGGHQAAPPTQGLGVKDAEGSRRGGHDIQRSIRPGEAEESQVVRPVIHSCCQAVQAAHQPTAAAAAAAPRQTAVALRGLQSTSAPAPAEATAPQWQQIIQPRGQLDSRRLDSDTSSCCRGYASC